MPYLECDAGSITFDLGLCIDKGAHAGRSTTVQMIIKLSKALGLDVIAEGFSTPEEARFLLGAGVVKAQGDLYSKPLETDVFAHMLKRGQVCETR